MIHLILPSFYMQKDSADRKGKQSQNTVRTPPEPSDCNGLAGPFLIIRTNRKTRCTARVLRFVQIWRDAVRLDLPRTSKARTYSSGSLQGETLGRYEKASSVFTSNKTFSRWNEVFAGAAIVSAILERVLHHRLESLPVSQHFGRTARGSPPPRPG